MKYIPYNPDENINLRIEDRGDAESYNELQQRLEWMRVLDVFRENENFPPSREHTLRRQWWSTKGTTIGNRTVLDHAPIEELFKAVEDLLASGVLKEREWTNIEGSAILRYDRESTNAQVAKFIAFIRKHAEELNSGNTTSVDDDEL